jgi:glycosyltransferase involved in cell wall biosynthesis
MQEGDVRRTDAPIRILYSIPNFTTAGSGQAMVNVIDRLDRRRFEPTVVVNHLGGPLVDHLERSGVEVLVAPVTVLLRPLPTLPWRAWRAGRSFRGRFDLWHSFHWQGEITEPLVARTSGTRAWMFTKKNMGWGSRSWWLKAFMARRIAVQNDEMTRRFFASRWLRGKVRYVPTGIDVEAWGDADPDDGLRSRLGIADDAVVVTCVGNVMEGKNQRVLVEAIAGVGGVHLVLAGRVLDDGYANDLTTLAERLGTADRVHLIGATGDVPGLLRVSDVFALASRAEGSPVAMVEAMAVGLPVVCSSIPGIRERVTDGSDGFLVEPDDVVAWTDRLSTLAGSRSARQRMGAAARVTAELRCRIETEVARYETIYLELTARPGGRVR